MIQLNQCVDHQATPSTELVLAFEKRQKSRIRVQLENGVEAAVVLPRGTVLRDGNLLRSDEGLIVKVCAACEEVSTVISSDPLLLTRVAYHLGNRHVPLQIGESWVRYLKDHVLDHMVESIGLSVLHESKPFEPESGAYGSHSHSHS